ncbi:MAG: hypothetical protein KAS73_14295 [Candidatus Sabulitectum sp.]|nr:hypothetical protein [Candidatus Sabulitectum sp.]
MKIGIILLFAITLTLSAQAPDYSNFMYVYADGNRIDLLNGYASPLVTDWDSDGDKDLLIGRFAYGNIMIFTNSGTNDSPILSYSGLLQAGGVTLSVPSG